jgi:Uma2 family endonuclease
MASRRITKEIDYPESDGKPMAESDVHRDWMVLLIELLRFFFAGQRVYVSGNLLLYYVEGDPSRSVSPDVFVVKDCDPRRRRIYKVWEEGKGPDFALETTSRKTRRQDLGPKMDLYARLGVGEYFLYDPLSEWLNPNLQGYRLVNGRYVRLEPDATGGLVSEQLGITFRVEDGQLALYVTATGERLMSGAEQAAEQASARKVAEARARREANARRAAEKRARELEEELARLRGGRKP